MSWAVTADPERFTEAVDWAAARIVITKEQALELDSRGRRQAFWVGNGLQLEQIQRVFDKLNGAQESGFPFEDWRREVRAELTNDAHAETVFRNAVQRALNAGRLRQQRDPDVLALRSIWEYDSVLDDRTTELCRSLGSPAVRLPADHPRWLTIYPPNHHRCRAGVRNITERQAATRGGVTPEDQLPDVEPDAGWAAAPDGDDDEPPKPKPEKTDPVLLAELERKRIAPPAPRRRKKTKAPKEHDPDHWEAQYRKPGEFAKDGYGEAARAVAWGRAMDARALSRPASEVLSQLRKVHERTRNPVVESILVEWEGVLEELGDRRIGSIVAGNANLRGAAAIAEHTRAVKRGRKLRFTGAGLPDEAVQFYDGLLDKSVTRPSVPVRRLQGIRAGYLPGSKQIHLDEFSGVGTAIHEAAHALEDHDGRALSRSLAFLAARTAGEAPQKLKELRPDRDYRDNEVTRTDRFSDPYMGKDYAPLGLSATEITSMGYEQLYRRWRDLWDEDRELLYFLLGQLAGR